MDIIIKEDRDCGLHTVLTNCLTDRAIRACTYIVHIILQQLYMHIRIGKRIYCFQQTFRDEERRYDIS